jgi:hypothetical protein
MAGRRRFARAHFIGNIESFHNVTSLHQQFDEPATAATANVKHDTPGSANAVPLHAQLSRSAVEISTVPMWRQYVHKPSQLL